MSKEIQLLKSKLEFCEKLLYLCDNLKIVFDSNKYDKMIGYYQNELSDLYKRLQELKEGEKYD